MHHILSSVLTRDMQTFLDKCAAKKKKNKNKIKQLLR